jgi:hypothetical protein
MSFLYPSFLWALGVLSVPIVIHLFNFRRTKKIYFSNTRFLRQVKEATTAKRKLKYYLILAARLLSLLLLVLAFTQPIIPAKEQLGSDRNITLYIDNSLSMSAQLKNKTKALDAAIEFSRNIVQAFPPDTHYKLVTNDFAPFSNSYKTKSETLDLLTELRLSPVSRSLQEIKDRIQQSGNASKEIFLISDFQKSTAGTPVLQTKDTLYRLHLVPLTYGNLSNVFVDSAYLDNPFSSNGEKNILRVKVRNDGKRDVDQLNLKLTINDIQAATVSVNVPQGGISEAAFDLATGLKGLNKAKISFNDFPVNFDNEFFLALNFTDKIRIIEIKNSTQPTPVEKVFGNKQVFNYAGFAVGNFNYSLLQHADLVVVNGLNNIEPSLLLALRGYLDNFGTVLFIPGDKPDEVSYRKLLQLPVSSSVEKTAAIELDHPDFNNPFFENVFEEKSVSLAMPKSSAVLSWGIDRTAILRFKNDQPFLSLHNQKGKLYTMASPLMNTYTDFYNNALFVPVMYRIAASGKKSESRLYYTLHENFISLAVDSLEGEESLRLVGKQEVVPSQRKVSERVFLDIPKFSISQGFYNVVASKDTVSLLAFNLDKTESYMDQYTGTEAKKLLGNGDNISLFDASSPDTFSNEIKARYLGTPLWKYAIMLTLLFILVEILLIRFLK